MFAERLAERKLKDNRKSQFTRFIFLLRTLFCLFITFRIRLCVCVCLKLKLADSSKFIPVQPQFLSVTNLRNEIENKRM